MDKRSGGNNIYVYVESSRSSLLLREQHPMMLKPDNQSAAAMGRSLLVIGTRRVGHLDREEALQLDHCGCFRLVDEGIDSPRPLGKRSNTCGRNPKHS